MQVRAALAASLVVPLALTACGNQDSGSGGEQPGGAWRTEHLEGATSVDFPTLLTTASDEALVLMLSDDGVLQSHLSVDGAEFEAGEPLDSGVRWVQVGGAVRLPDGGWFALGSGGQEVVDGDEQIRHDPVAFRSADGLVWDQVEISGFADPMEVNALEVVDGTIVVVGAYRMARDPSMGGFQAQAWTSVDGETFTEADLPGVPVHRGYDDGSYAGDLLESNGRLLASGRVGRHAAIWASDDAGRTWSAITDPVLEQAYGVSALVESEGTLLAGTSSSGTAAIRSTDGGTTWEPIDTLPVNEEADGWAPFWAGGGRFLTLTGVDDSSWSTPEVCYADLDQCGNQPGPTLAASPDGGTWTSVATDGLGEIDHVAGTDDGRLLVMTGEGEGRTVHTWPAGTQLPEAEEPAAPETVELVTLDEGEAPEIGVRYAHPLYTHCGIEWLWFGDTTWRRTDDGPDYETGAGDGAPEGWPVPEDGGSVYGYATVREDGVLEYTSDDGTVLATYEERRGAPGCM